MCEKAASTYSSALKMVPNQFMTQEICDKVVDTYPFLSDCVSDL